MRLLLPAPPGAGQGTQGERLAAWSGATAGARKITVLAASLALA